MKPKITRGGLSRIDGVHPPHPYFARKDAVFLDLAIRGENDLPDRFLIRLKYFRTAFSCRRRFNSACRSNGASPGSISSRFWLSQRVSGDSSMPRSCAISGRVRPLVTASGLYRRSERRHFDRRHHAGTCPRKVQSTNQGTRWCSMGSGNRPTREFRHDARPPGQPPSSSVVAWAHAVLGPVLGQAVARDRCNAAA